MKKKVFYYLVVFEQLRPFQLEGWSNKIPLHVKWYRFKMNCSQHLKASQLWSRVQTVVKDFPLSHASRNIHI